MKPTRYVLAATLLCLLAPRCAIACQGQAGKTIFEDDFSDDSGGWDQRSAKYQSGALTISFEKAAGYSSMVPAFSIPEGDFCVDFVLPPSLTPTDYYGAGMEFWSRDYNNYYDLELFSTGRVALEIYAGGHPTLVFSVEAPSYNRAPSATNELRAVVKGGKVTAYLNGVKLKTIRAQQPEGPWRFAVTADIQKQAPDMQAVRFTHFKVTSGE